MKFDPTSGLIPAIVQDVATGKVLMLGYMNQTSFDQTLSSGLVTFYSRSRNEIWVKGATSGNYLNLVDWKLDCDKDCLLIKANPSGPVCHTGSDTCWGEVNSDDGIEFLNQLQGIIESRKSSSEEGSYTSKLFQKGVNKIAQKVGEEAVEMVIEAKDENDELFIEESADLLFHYLVLLSHKGKNLKDVVDVLRGRHQPKSSQ